MTIRSEAGGVDAADFAEMLMRMYLRWAERHKYPTEVYDVSYAEEAGIKSATFAVKVPYAYGTLSVEQGTHRLVRISPFDNQGRRQTSFAGVEVLPVVEQTDHVDIPENEIRVDVFRSSGPGGQSVNTTDSAVRMTHIPTGIVVSCQNEKSQIQNRAAALRVLQARLLVVRQQEQKAEMDALKGEGSSWGNQMRSYVLHPYQMVKDLRTEQETGNTAAVLDGDIDAFIEAGIRWRRQQETVPASCRRALDGHRRSQTLRDRSGRSGPVTTRERPASSVANAASRARAGTVAPRDRTATRHQALPGQRPAGPRRRVHRDRQGRVRLPHRVLRFGQVDLPAAAAEGGHPTSGHDRRSTARR